MRETAVWSSQCLRVALTALAVHHATGARAEPVTDRVLASAQVVTQNRCAQLKISFNFRIRYAGHFPQAQGNELRIMVRAIDSAVAASEILTRRESLRAPDDKTAAIKTIEFDVDSAGGPALTVRFQRSVHFQVAQGPDFQSVVVAISRKKNSKSCRPEFPQVAGGWVTEVHGPPAKRETAAALMDQARAALKKNKPKEAIRLLRKVLALPENKFSARARELTGLAHQRSGDLANAKADYEDYLARYPKGDGPDRVRQRLAAVLTATGDTSAKKPAKRFRSRRDKARDSGGTTWSVSGSASQFYIRDDSFRVLDDPSLPPNLNNNNDDHDVHQNELLSSFDFVGTLKNNASKWKFRFSGTEEHSFSGDEDEVYSVAALYLDATILDWNAQGRVGRQTRNSGGVLGRFDGLLLSWRALPGFAVNLVGGSPVNRRKDQPFKEDKLFFGASVDIGPFFNGLDFSLFGIEQLDQDVIDRQAIGFEARYLTPSFSSLVTVDYDVHFGEFNAAVASASWTLEDKSTLHGGLEYRKSPFLLTSNALQGQPFTTLFDLLKERSLAEVEQLALDRTPSFRSLSFGYARPLTEHIQASADITVSETSGTVASGGVDAAPATGPEAFYAAQVIATDFFETNDQYIVGLRLADTDTSDLYVLDFNSRYPVSPELRVGPRLRVGYRIGNSIDLTEYTVLPSVLVDYNWTPDLSFEVELGANWTQTTQNNVREENTELFITAGFRYDFYADGVIK